MANYGTLNFMRNFKLANIDEIDKLMRICEFKMRNLENKEKNND